MTDKDRIDYLGGQVAALEAFALAVINSHPDIQLLNNEITRLNVVQESNSLPTQVSEAYLDGQAAIAGDIQAHVDAVLKKSKP